MIKNAEARIWVNRIVAFLGGGLIILAVMYLAVVEPVNKKNTDLVAQMEDIENGAAKLLGEANVYVLNGSYDNAEKTLNALFEKHPASSEAAEGMKLFAEVEEKVKALDLAWESASGAIRAEWEKTTSAQMRAKMEQDRALMETNMTETLNKEWEKVKAKIRQEWEETVS